ncbi:MAG: NAD(P)-dependent alcohol dehydrogenase [Candidatus Bathyarchaeota archaeon]|nr:NAD(P)-dependent alcohol dehydrogenase [Candidatus Bathyarchaeota archaeon]
MKAAVYEKYGPPDVIQIKEVEKPVPKEDEMLVKIHATSINYVDWQVLVGESTFLRLTTGGLLKPKMLILGDDISGIVEAVGEKITRFKPGDMVLGLCNTGGFAEYRCVSEEYFVSKPSNMSFEQAAAIPEAAIPALLGLRDNGRIKPGQKVLICGASGGVGTYAVQIAKSYAAEVTGVCSTGKIDYVYSIGADHVIDYTKEDFSKNHERYDLIFAAGGNRSIFDYKRALAPEGVYVCIGGSLSQYFQGMLLGPLLSLMDTKKMGAMFAQPKTEDFQFLLELYEAGKLVPVIDRVFPFSETAEALRYYGEGKARGKIVISIEH